RAGGVWPGAVPSPIVSRFGVTRGEDAGSAPGLFDRVHRLWVTIAMGGTAIGIATLVPLIEAWLGDGHGDAAFYASFLILAYGVGLMLGTPLAYLRAAGRPWI